MARRTNNTKPTLKQKNAVKNLTENQGNIGKAMRDAGYSEYSSHNPKNLTKSKGFEELCKKVGLTDDFILEALEEDIRLKPQNRKGELELATKIRGLITERREIQVTNTEPSKELRRSISQRIKDLL